MLKYGWSQGAWGLGPGYASYVQYVNGVLYAIRAGSYGFGQRIAKRKQEATACKEEEEKKEKRQSWSDEASSRTGQDRTGQTGQGRQGRTRQGGVSTLPTLHMCRDEAGLRGRELAGSRVCRWKREMASKEGRRQGSGEKNGKSNEGGPRDWACRHGHYNTEYIHSTYKQALSGMCSIAWQALDNMEQGKIHMYIHCTIWTVSDTCSVPPAPTLWHPGLRISSGNRLSLRAHDLVVQVGT